MLPVLLGFLVWRSGGLPWPAIRRVGLAGVLGGLGLIGAFGKAITAFQATTVTNAVFLFAASPVLAVVMGERVTARTWIAIGIAVLGIFVMVREGLQGGALLGNLAALVSALGLAAFSVTRRWRRLDDSLPSVLLGAGFSALARALLASQTGQPLADVLWSPVMGAVALSVGTGMLDRRPASPAMCPTRFPPGRRPTARPCSPVRWTESLKL
jgi:drug/metabolite transporter (DMT)-like permease